MKKRAKKRARSATVMHRLFVLKALDGCIALAIGHAVGSGDTEMTMSLERIEALLDHEMRNFLKLPCGVEG